MRTIYQLHLVACTLYYPTLEQAEDMKNVLGGIGYTNELKIDKDIAKYLLLNEGK